MFKKNNTRKFGKKPVSEFDNKIVDIRRVTRVVSGGRRFSFRVSVVIGDRKGKVGVGTGKATDTALAIEKAVRAAKKKLIKPALTKDMSIPYEVESKFSSARVLLKPGPKGHGLVAGGPVRVVLELAGIKNVNAKILSRSKNKLNNAKAAIKALESLKEKKGIVRDKKEAKEKIEEVKESK